MMGAPWRQAMLAQQNFQFPTGLNFPTRNATGGWQMGASAVPQAPAAPPVAPPPMMGMQMPKPLSFAAPGYDPNAFNWNSSFSGW